MLPILAGHLEVPGRSGEARCMECIVDITMAP